MRAGQRVAQGPGGVSWCIYVRDDGQERAAAQFRGDLVRMNERGPYVLDNRLEHLYLSDADVRALLRCMPADPPVLEAQLDLLPPTDTTGSSWEPKDLTATIVGVASGAITKPEPTIGRLSDDSAALFYCGRVNGVQGESGSGKSYLCQLVAAQEIASGHHVLYIDAEDDEIGIVSRLLSLGVDDLAIATYVHYVSPTEMFGPAAATHINAVITAYAPSVAVLDSVGELHALNNVKDIDGEVAAWFRMLPRAIAAAGPAVITVDHVTKSAEGRGLYAVGSQRKRAAITGCSLMVDPIRAMAQGRSGTSKLTVAKDRLGFRAMGTVAAHFTLDATSDTLVATLTAPTTSTTTDGGFRPTQLMEKVSRWVETHPGDNRSDIDKARLGRSEWVRTAATVLVSEGWVRTEQHGQALKHYSVKAYRQDEDGGQ